MKLITLLLLFPAFAFAKTPACKEADWVFHGESRAQILAYNAFAKKLESAKDPVAELNKFKDEHGLPLRVAGGFRKVKDYLEEKEEGPGGTAAVVFLSSLRANSSLDLTFESVYEVKDPQARKSLRQWPVTFEVTPSAVRGEDLIFKTTLVGLCGTEPRSVTLAVKPDGEYQVINGRSLRDSTQNPLEKCAGSVALFAESAYATCAEFKDTESKAKRVLVWQLPMT